MTKVSLNKIAEDIAVIKTDVKYIQRDLGDIKDCVESNDDRITTVESDYSSIKERVSLFNYFQTGLTIIVGAVASWLGVKK